MNILGDLVLFSNEGQLCLFNEARDLTGLEEYAFIFSFPLGRSVRGALVWEVPDVLFVSKSEGMHL